MTLENSVLPYSFESFDFFSFKRQQVCKACALSLREPTKLGIGFSLDPIDFSEILPSIEGMKLLTLSHFDWELGVEDFTFIPGLNRSCFFDQDGDSDTDLNPEYVVCRP